MFKFNSVPAYSIGKYRPKPEDNALPGPGAYDTTKLIDIKEKRTGTTVVYKPGKPESPKKFNDIGPGAYETIHKNHVKGYYNDKGKGDRSLIKNNDVPGPGQYNYDQVIEKLTKANGVVFDRSKRDKDNTGLPLGPGQYTMEKYTMFGGKNKAWSFNKSKNNQVDEKEIPGPGSYEYGKYFASRDKGVGISLSKAPRLDNYESLVPGPGRYDNKIKALTNKGYHFPKSQEKIKKEEKPGPGHYRPIMDQLQAKTPGFKFDKTAQIDKSSNIPGPGQYNTKVTALTSKGTRFSKSRRYDDGVNDKPAPGQYDILNLSKPSGIVFDKRAIRTQSVNPNPGPGQYDQQNKQKPKFALQKATLRNNHNDVPGPGHYDAKIDDWNKPVTAFDRTNRLDKENALQLGPGHYNIPHSIPDVPRYNYPDVSKRKIHI